MATRITQAQRRSQMIDGLRRAKTSTNLVALHSSNLGISTPKQKDEVNNLVAEILGDLKLLMERTNV